MTSRPVTFLCPPAQPGEADDVFARLRRSLPVDDSSPLLRNAFVVALLNSQRGLASSLEWRWSEVLRSFDHLLLWEAFLILRLRAVHRRDDVLFYLSTTQAWLKALRPHRSHAASCIQLVALAHLYRPGGAMVRRSIRELGLGD